MLETSKSIVDVFDPPAMLEEIQRAHFFLKIQRISYSQICPGNQKKYLTSFFGAASLQNFWQISCSEFLIGTKFEKSVEYAEPD